MVVNGISPEKTIELMHKFTQQPQKDSPFDGGILGAIVLGLIVGLGNRYLLRKSRGESAWEGTGGAVAGFFIGTGIDASIK